MEDNQNNILLSISCITYNQELFISQCLEGFLIQKTNFPFEILIHDDASTDRTADIIRDYEQKYPDIIKPIYQKENQYSKGVRGIAARFNFSRAKGKYIAICEGDDYWTDPDKLQKQVDFMEANPEYTLVYHRVNELWEESGIIKPETMNSSNEELSYTVLDLAKGNFIHTPSVLIRSNSIDFNKFTESSKVIDYYYWMLCAQNGKIKYLPEIMAVYRISENSTWVLKTDISKTSYWLIMLVQLLNDFKNDNEAYSELFIHLKEIFKGFYRRCKETREAKVLDEITKQLLLVSFDFQNWWFIYMLHLKVSRLYRLKYYFYLLFKQSLNSFWLIKKCLY